MKNSEAFYFIGHLFTLNVVENRREEVLRRIESNEIDWDKVVKLASDQLVLPLLYVKFRDSDLLGYLPDGLAQHLEMVYDLNLKRNQQLLVQADEIARCLREVGIKPIFIKGMANLLSGLYSDLGERMMLDIDFLVHADEIPQAAEALKSIGYNTYAGEMYWDKSTKHYPRLTNSSRISDIEMHFNPASEKACAGFGYSDILRNGIEHDLFILPSDLDGLRINFLHAMYDNKGYTHQKCSLRDMYDVFCYSTRVKLSSFNPTTEQLKVADAYFNVLKKALGLGDDFFLSNRLSSKRFISQHKRRLDSRLNQKIAIILNKLIVFAAKVRAFLFKYFYLL